MSYKHLIEDSQIGFFYKSSKELLGQKSCITSTHQDTVYINYLVKINPKITLKEILKKLEEINIILV